MNDCVPEYSFLLEFYRQGNTFIDRYYPTRRGEKGYENRNTKQIQNMTDQKEGDKSPISSHTGTWFMKARPFEQVPYSSTAKKAEFARSIRLSQI